MRISSLILCHDITVDAIFEDEGFCTYTLNGSGLVNGTKKYFKSLKKLLLWIIIMNCFSRSSYDIAVEGEIILVAEQEHSKDITDNPTMTHVIITLGIPGHLGHDWQPDDDPRDNDPWQSLDSLRTDFIFI